MAHLGYLENVDFLQQFFLPWEFVFLHIRPTAMTSESGDTVNDPPTPNALEGSDCVLNTQDVEVLVPVHDKLHGFHVHKIIGVKSHA